MDKIYKEAIKFLLEDLYIRSSIDALQTGLKFKHDRADKTKALIAKIEEDIKGNDEMIKGRLSMNGDKRSF